MKLSLSWIFDHIDADWKSQDLQLIVSKFNTITAEIEKTFPFTIELDDFFIAQCTLMGQSSFQAYIPELDVTCQLPLRDKTVDLITANNKTPLFMIKRDGKSYEWASLAHFGGDKEGLLPALDIAPEKLQGQWRSDVETEDVILEIDNKTITHRPDMWGHRGFAREIAAFLDLPLRPVESFFVSHPVLYFEKASKQIATSSFIIENRAPDACRKFTGLHVKQIENRPSPLPLALRLIKIGLRPVNAIIDLTNYIAYDWSQPVHAYDTSKIQGNSIIIRMAQEGELLQLLDGTALALSSQDIVIADPKNPLCLAGVRGGAASAISETTSSIFFESANFVADFVRKSSVRHKTRTDSSARFEKTLDPNQTIEAVWRFLKLLQQYNIKADIASEIVSVGIPQLNESIIEVSHTFLEKRMGVTLKEIDILEPLTRLGFKVLRSYSHNEQKDLVYVISVPMYRASKDVKIKEDILEEVTRFYGFERLPAKLPKINRTPFDMTSVMRTRTIKNYMTRAAHMIEQQNYVLFDEQFMTGLGLQDKMGPTVNFINPVSENNYRLITSLVPGLLKNIKENHTASQSLRLFEWARVWILKQPFDLALRQAQGGPQDRIQDDKKTQDDKNGRDNNTGQEYRKLAGVIVEKRKPVCFYQGIQYIKELFEALNFDSTRCEFVQAKEFEPWYRQYQTANIIFDGKSVGTAGLINTLLLPNIDLLPESDAFIFELNGDFLLTNPAREKSYKTLSKFQENYFDVSFMVPLAITTQELENLLKTISDLIKKVELIDFFEKEEWLDKRSLTLRVWLESSDRTLDKSDIDELLLKSVSCAQALGAQLRGSL